MIKYFDINKDGLSIKCKLMCNNIRSINKLVLFLHGFGGHKDTKAAEKFAENYLSKNKNGAVLTFNLPAHGDDVKKKLSLSDCDQYISIVLGYVKNTLLVEDVYCYATSFGGYLALKYICEHDNPFKRLALRCPAINMYESILGKIVAKGDLEKLEKGKDASVGFDHKIMVTKNFLDELRDNDIRENEFVEYAEDILVIQGTRDEIIDKETVENFCDDNIIECLLVEKADHRFSDPSLMGVAIKHIIEFFKI